MISRTAPLARKSPAGFDLQPAGLPFHRRGRAVFSVSPARRFLPDSRLLASERSRSRLFICNRFTTSNAVQGKFVQAV